MNLRERFDAKVDRTPGHGPEGLCHVWTGTTTRGGYGMFWLNGRMQLAHRVARFLATGEWPAFKVLHSCDFPPCVREDHLFDGTQADNVADCVAKGRARGGSQPGESNAHAKLTAGQVDKIREATGTLRSIGERFGVSESAVSMIRSGQRWRR